MRFSKLIKSIVGILVLVLLLSMSLLLAGASSPKAKSDETTEIDCKEIMALGLSKGSIRLIEERNDVAGNVIQHFVDDQYSYYFSPSERKVLVIVANDALMERIVRDASGLSMKIVPAVDNDIMSCIEKFFPEYNLETVIIDLNTESGSPIEFFQYTIRDFHNDIQTNSAQISFSIDGQLTFVYGSHNRLDASKDYSKISDSEAIRIACTYLVDKKTELENAANADASKQTSDEYIIATEDMVLPDGVKVGDTFKIEKLPIYEIFINTSDDMDVITNQKLVYNDTVAWLVEFTIKTSWGEIDTIFNPLVHIYVDATTGKILEMNMTDGS